MFGSAGQNPAVSVLELFYYLVLFFGLLIWIIT